MIYTAKTYMTWERIGTVFNEGKKEYVMVRNPKTGVDKKVCAYGLKEFQKKYPDYPVVDEYFKSREELFTHEDGYVWVVKNQNEVSSWEQGAYYCVEYGWYIPPTINNPSFEIIKKDFKK